MKLLSAERMKAADRACVERFGIPTVNLMRQAGGKTAVLARRKMAEHGLDTALVVCGKGSNGGDGLAAALHLKSLGLDVRVFLLCQPGDLTGDAAAVLADVAREKVLLQAGVEAASLAGALRERLGRGLVVDAVFGTGFRPPMEGRWAAAIEAVNDSGLPVLSIDLPSGMDADRPGYRGMCVRADWTLTLGAPKPALFVYPAAETAGEVSLADIGHPEEVLDEGKHPNVLMEAGWCRSVWRERKPDTHKGTFGHVLVVAGSRRMPGAALLAAMGALRSGAGLVTLAMPGDLAGRLIPVLPEVLPLALPEDAAGEFSEEAVRELFTFMEGKKALVIGPGLGRGTGVAAMVQRLLQICPLPMVLDADALNVAAEDSRALSGRLFPTVMTPHPGELGRLMDGTAEFIQSDRITAALRAAARFEAVVLLKGAGTLVADPSGSYKVNASGNAGMASGGMGDVLAGLVGGLAAQGWPVDEAAGLGAYLHGLAGDLAARRIGSAGFTASELAALIPAAAAAVAEGHEDIERL